MPEQPVPRPNFRNLEIWPLRTERLSIRPAELEDAAGLWVHRGLPEVGTWLGWHPVDREDWDATYPSKYLDYLIVERNGGYRQKRVDSAGRVHPLPPQPLRSQSPSVASRPVS